MGGHPHTINTFNFLQYDTFLLPYLGKMDSSNEDQIQPHFIQNVVVMRHGDRIDSFESLWPSTAARPWDPPLVDAGKVRAFYTGRKFRNQLGFPIHRVFVSPFLRCLQTASEVVSALCAVADQHDDPNDMSSHGVEIDPSKIKVSSRAKRLSCKKSTDVFI